MGQFENDSAPVKQYVHSVLSRIFGLGGEAVRCASIEHRVGGSGGILPRKILNFTLAEMQSSAFI